ncbi:SDR family NAD(P)-dependent oxidoreductase [Streptomyces sp. bgisy126]|uniref:SDR family NAD(P)-dependent oxidoreductase n=1 Tax=unclassified Streptomyces TaxID=2593676 RepID=UPI003EBF7633
MDFGHSPKTREHIDRVGGFMAPHVLPREPESLAAPRDQEDRRAVSRTASGEPLGNLGGGVSRRVLVTGGASGPGRALVERHAAAGDRVLVADRDRPDELPPGEGSFLRLDVRIHGDRQRALRWCEDHWGGLDVLVDNAGVTAAGRVEHFRDEDRDWILEVNLKGVVQGCRTFVPLFKRQRSGHIVNIASSPGLLNAPGATSYNASKAAVVSLSETIRQEPAPFGIRTALACPGPFRTTLRAGLHSPGPEPAELADRATRNSPHTAQQVARRIVHAVDKGHFLVLTRPTDRRALCLKRLFPRVADAQAAKKWRRTAAQLGTGHPQERRRAA